MIRSPSSDVERRGEPYAVSQLPFYDLKEFEMVTYRDLGVRPFINARGTVTTLGGSIMPSRVLAAMQEAAGSFVDLNLLNEKAGEYLAERIGVEGAFISCGAASGMQLSAAACLTGTDPDKTRRLPHTEGWKNEFVVSSVDRHTYIHQGIEACGGKLIPVGTQDQVETDDILAGIGENTAAIVHFLGKQSEDQLREIIIGAKEMGVPVVVDAAAQLPPRSNLTNLVGMGTSLAVFSGGKGMRGPQNTGIVLGEKGYIDAVRLNASPNSAIGRGMKVGKEEIMGLIAAIDRFLSGTDQEDREAWLIQVTHIIETVGDVSGVRATIVEDRDAPGFAPRCRIELEGDRTAEEVVQAMLEGEPPVVINGSGKELRVDPMTLLAGDEKIVARRLKEVLEG